MIDSQERPLATFALIAYNQERFIREAVNGAFSQTYSPLQIILSDDCSSDCTFDILQELAAAYTGPHQLILNRNSSNIGIGAHVNAVMKLADGAFIISAAGDDISFPTRTERLVNHFLNNKKCYSVYSNMIVIDADGNIGSEWGAPNYKHPEISLYEVCKIGIVVYGCAHAWRKDIYTLFGPIDDRVIHEDFAIPYRSALLGDVDYLDEVLVYYRRHDQNIFARGDQIRDIAKLQSDRIKHAKGMLGVRNTMARDLALYLKYQNADLSKYKREITETDKRLLAAQIDVDLIGCKTTICKFSLLFKAVFYRVGYKQILKLIAMEFFPAIIMLKRRM